MSKIPFTFYVDPNVLKRIKQRAERNDVSAGWIIRQAVEWFLNQPPVNSYVVFDDAGDRLPDHEELMRRARAYLETNEAKTKANDEDKARDRESQ